MKRGRKPIPCPDYDRLRELAAHESRITMIAAAFGVSPKAAARWLGEIGIEHVVKPQRPRTGRAWYDIAYCPELSRRIRTRLYEVWASMRKRCLVPSCPDWPRYGGRGVTICDEWLRDYGAFRDWAVTRGAYRKGLTLDRADSNGNYEPSNCRFVTKADQQLNIRRAIKLTVEGRTETLAQWARISGVSPDVIRTRYYKGWPHDRAVFEPIQSSSR